MSNETMTSTDALNVNAPEPTEQPATVVLSKRAQRVLAAQPKLTAAQKLQAQINDLRAKKRLATEAERAKKPARRSRDSGNTWQIKVAAAANPNGKIEAIATAVKPKLVKNAHGLLPTTATIGTIRTDFYHSLRVFKSLTAAQQKNLLAAI
jgi:hypothetical protein